MESTTKQNSYAKLLSQADTVVTRYDGTDATQTIYTLTDADLSSMLNGNFMVVQALPSSSSLQSGNYVNERAYFGDTNQPQPDNPPPLWLTLTLALGWLVFISNRPPKRTRFQLKKENRGWQREVGDEGGWPHRRPSAT